MQKRKKLALLSFLLLLSVGSAVVAQASGVLQILASNVEEAEINIQTASVSLILTPEDREKTTDIVLMDSQIQELLEDADNYTIQVSEVFDIHKIDFDVHEISGGVALVPKEGLAQAIIEINNDYGEEFGVQVVTVTVDLVNEEITETEVYPEIRRPKVHEDVLSPSELVQNPSEYDDVIVTASGKVSLLGEVFGYLFMLDETVTVFYRHEEANLDVSNIENGDTVTVTGRFSSPDTIYALKIEKP
jgi:acetolactate synthase small subunit